MNKLYWYLRQLNYQFGWQALLGLTLIVYASFYYFTILCPAQLSLLEVQRTFEEANATSLVEKRPTESDQQKSAKQLQEFTRSFPEVNSINMTWEQIAKVAKKSGLTIDHMQYASSQEKYGDLRRYELNIPLKATYLEIQSFLAEVIRSIPNVALISISFKRDSIDSALIDTHIDLAVFVRNTNAK